jgi:4-carboxymuconolactone decarboxylase
MTPGERPSPELITLDDATRNLVRLAAVIAAGTESSVRDALVHGSSGVPATWIEELILQSYLFAGFPRTLNAMREWRRVAPMPDPATLQESREQPKTWMARGKDTCRRVYGAMYDRLRVNIRSLHPLLDEWMIVEGYGKVLSRPGLDLPRRELCIIAACAASRQDRQLHSHLHGAWNVGVAPQVITDAIDALDPVIDVQAASAARLLWARVKGK